jgi:hypothetical protein
MDLLEWPRLTKIVQMALNQSKSKSLAGEAPITVMTGIKPMSTLQTIAIPTDINPQYITLEELLDLQREARESASIALDNMHKKVKAAADNTRERARISSQRFEMTQYAIGDFVLYALVKNKQKNKLQVRWNGPAEVVDAVSQWIFKIRDLVTGDIRECHASRMKFYSDSSLHVSEALKGHIAHNNEGHVIQDFKSIRYSPH